MKKTWLAFILPLVLCLTILPVSGEFAQDHPPRLVDNADLLGTSDEESLTLLLDSISEEYSCDTAIVTTNSLGGKSAQAFADDYFDYNGYGYGDDWTGIIFVISMGEREWAFSTCGGAIGIFDDYRLMQMEDEIIPYLSDGDYYAAFEKYADMCEDFLEIGIDASYDKYNEYYGDPYGDYYDEYYYDYGYTDYTRDTYGGMDSGEFTLICVVGSFAAAVVVSLIILSSWKNELNTVHFQRGAANYIKQGSFRITRERDIYLYRKVTKIARDTDSNRRSGGRSGGSSVHRSSSGRSHGGRSGRF